MAEISRREWMQGAIALGVAAGLPAWQERSFAAPAPATTQPTQDAGSFHWLESETPTTLTGTTWGVPFAKGESPAGQTLQLVNDKNNSVPAQTWPLAYWPDGSMKWLAVAIPPGAGASSSFKLQPGTPADVGTNRITTRQADDTLEISTGLIRCVVGRSATSLIRSVERSGRVTLQSAELVAMRQDGPSDGDAVRRETFVGQIKEAVIEQSGPVRAVVRISGEHQNAAGRAWLPFTVRLYFYAGSDVIRVMHTFIFDGDEQKDFLCGLGLRFNVPMSDPSYDRHVRFVGEGHGLFAEAVRGITGLRRDPGADVRAAQIAGKPTPPLAEWDPRVSEKLAFVPEWGDYTLTQLSADGFQIRKRTKPGCGWIAAGAGKRAAGVAYVGGISGGVSFGVRDFWEKHPAQLDLRQMQTETAQATAWLWSPEAPAMDLRMYHDVMGMSTYDDQNKGLDITYEDYEPGYGTPYGIARTSELQLRIEAATPAREGLVEFADVVRKPPLVVCTPQRYLQSAVFGQQWTLPDSSEPTRKWIEDRLSFQLSQYVREVDQRSWYGFWDYGDVMHSYDDDRHVWRYDVGGFAWDNSELSTDLWLWMSYLRTGRADTFRLAEAMCRHTGEVDVYHLGRFRGLGTRHGVQHWADSSKQSRISTAIYRRPYYFMTADERVGDLLHEQLHAIEAEKKIVITRKVKPHSPTLPLPSVEDPPEGGPVVLGAMNWGNAMAAWITEAERTNDPAWHKKIVTAMRGVSELPLGFYTSGWTMNIDTGEIVYDGSKEINASHLTTCFGLPEMCTELVLTYGKEAPKFAATWAQYGRMYNGTAADRRRELGGTFKEAGNMRDTHARCTAFAARLLNDPALAKRAWAELLGEHPAASPPLKTTHFEGPTVLNPIDAVPMSTNGSAQWGLSAMECLAFVGQAIP